MKNICLMLSMLVCALNIHAQECFHTGMKWVMDRFHSDYPSIKNAMIVELKDDIEFQGELCHKMLVNDKEVGYIKSDAQRVWFMSNQTLDGWQLVYDFGIAAGDEVTLYTMPTGTTFNELEEQETSLVKCIARGQVAGYITITVECAFTDKKGHTNTLQTTWVKGIGCTSDWFKPFRIPDYEKMFRVGGVFVLTEVWDKDQQIYYSSFTQDVAISQVEEPEKDELNIEIRGNDCHLKNIIPGTPIEVYDTNGMRILSYIINSSETSFILPNHGLYIINCEGRTKKIAI